MRISFLMICVMAALAFEFPQESIAGHSVSTRVITRANGKQRHVHRHRGRHHRHATVQYAAVVRTSAPQATTNAGATDAPTPQGK